jgi:hypothetical protein
MTHSGHPTTEESREPVGNIDFSQGTRKKTFGIRVKPRTALYEIYLEGGGSIPEALSGTYTSVNKAMKSIELYEALRIHIEESKRPYHRSRAYANKNKTRD